MKVRAVIMDVYQTLLEVRPPAADRDRVWERLWFDFFRQAPPLRLEDFSARCEQIIRRDHAEARARGIPHPEVVWAAVAAEAAPDLAALDPADRDRFLLGQAQTWHEVRLMPGAAEALRILAQRGLWLGIASNAQPYTLEELSAALAPEGLGLALFDPELCFWSFAHGFSKPDPHVVRILTARLALRGLGPGQILMVGDRLDNDLDPARAQGWQTWRLNNQEESPGGGSWRRLIEAGLDG